MGVASGLYNYGSGKTGAGRVGPSRVRIRLRMEVLAEDHGFACGDAVAAERKQARQLNPILIRVDIHALTGTDEVYHAIQNCRSIF